MGFGVSVGAGASGAFGGSSASAWEERGLFRKRKRLIAATAPRAVECLITGDLIRRISLNEKERKGASFRVTWKPATRAPLYLLRKTAFHEARRRENVRGQARGCDDRHGAEIGRRAAGMGIEEVADATPAHGHAAFGVAGRRRGCVPQTKPSHQVGPVAWIRGVGDRLLAEREDLAAKVQDSGRRAGRAHRSRSLVERPALAPGAFVDSGLGGAAGDLKRRFFEGEEARPARYARTCESRRVGNPASRSQSPRRHEGQDRRIERSARLLFPFEDVLQNSEELRRNRCRDSRRRGIQPGEGSVVPPRGEKRLDALDLPHSRLTSAKRGVPRRSRDRQGKRGPHGREVPDGRLVAHAT